jgi:hypothetical protein
VPRAGVCAYSSTIHNLNLAARLVGWREAKGRNAARARVILIGDSYGLYGCKLKL